MTNEKEKIIKEIYENKKVYYNYLYKHYGRKIGQVIDDIFQDAVVVILEKMNNPKKWNELKKISNNITEYMKRYCMKTIEYLARSFYRNGKYKLTTSIENLKILDVEYEGVLYQKDIDLLKQHNNFRDFFFQIFHNDFKKENPKCHQKLELRLIFGLGIKEISKIVGQTYSGTKKSISNCRKKLRKFIENHKDYKNFIN